MLDQGARSLRRRTAWEWGKAWECEGIMICTGAVGLAVVVGVVEKVSGGGGARPRAAPAALARI